MRRANGARNPRVGRVGGLAVALGVGAAMASGAGVAWADTPDADGSPSADRGANARQAPEGHAAKSTAALGLQATTLNTNIALKEMELERQAAQHGETMSVQRGRLALEAMDKEVESLLKRAQAD